MVTVKALFLQVCVFICVISLFTIPIRMYNDSEGGNILDKPEIPRSAIPIQICDKNNSNGDCFVSEGFEVHGHWTPGSEYIVTHSVFSKTGRCNGKNTKKLRFVFHEDRLNHINAVRELRQILMKKKLLLIGDSIMREYFYGLSELLKSQITTRWFGDIDRRTIYRGRVTYLRASLIYLSNQTKDTKMKSNRAPTEGMIREEVANHDIIFFNQGVHFDWKALLLEGQLQIFSIGQMLYSRYTQLILS